MEIIGRLQKEHPEGKLFLNRRGRPWNGFSVKNAFEDLEIALGIQEMKRQGIESQVMRHLVYVHDELGRKGWPGVGALPAHVLAKALVQAEMLAGKRPSPTLSMLVDRLRLLQVEAELRAQRESDSADLRVGESLEVSEATHEEFEEMQRSWAGTPPPGLVLSRPDR